MTIEMNKMKKDMMDMMSMMSTMNIIVVCLLLVCLHEGALSKKGVLGNGGNIFGQIMTPHHSDQRSQVSRTAPQGNMKDLH